MAYEPELTLAQQASRKKEYFWKISLRSLTVLLTTIGIIIQGLVTKQAFSDRNDNGYYGSYDHYIWFSPESMTMFALSLCWCSAELITIRINKRGIPPGALVGLDLIIWMAFIGVGTTQICISGFNALSVVAGVIALICVLLHFVLFVWACVDTDRRREGRKQEMLEKIAMTMVREQLKNTAQTNDGKGSYDVPAGMMLVPYNVPPGMVLVPITALQHVEQPLPSYAQQAAEL